MFAIAARRLRRGRIETPMRVFSVGVVGSGSSGGGGVSLLLLDARLIKLFRAATGLFKIFFFKKIVLNLTIFQDS